MSTTAAITIFVGIVALVCGVVAGVGILAKHELKKRTPSSKALAKLTPTGIALCACLTAALVVGAAARKLAPNSVLGSFISTEQGLFVAIVLAWLAFTIAAIALHMVGHPIMEMKARRDV